jgi:hypothetical protein
MGNAPSLLDRKRNEDIQQELLINLFNVNAESDEDNLTHSTRQWIEHLERITHDRIRKLTKYRPRDTAPAKEKDCDSVLAGRAYRTPLGR